MWVEPGLRGTITFLFTDLEGSTGLWEQDAAAMDAALRAHDEVLGSVFVRHGGRVFSRAGDSFAVAFSSPSDAVAAAVDVQRRVSSLPGPMTLSLRIGLHSGDAYEREGDYFGPVVNRAARLMATAHGGQIVCSLTTAELARAALAPDVVLRLLGTFQLKDLLAPETVFQLEAAGLEATFPPLRTLDAARHNLPVQQTRLIGRDGEIATVLEALGRSRLVTLTGVGGCGKTRLALAVGAELASARDGVFFVGLAPVTNGDGVVAAVTEAMGVRLAREEPAALARFLGGQDVVLILDNCEHLLDEVSDLVDTVLTGATGPRVVATSREALGSTAEHVVRVPSLPMHASAEQNAALTLLVECAQRAGVSSTRLHEGHDVLAEMCRRLDGIPLAIELAAARLEQFTATDLLDRLDQRFDLLVGGHGRRRQRQQTLQAVMDWSWELLTADERRLLAVLSTFSGPWTLASAETIGARFVDGSVAVIHASLVAKSLVEPVFGSSKSRYRFLETVRLFANSKLVEFNLAAEARTAHAQQYVEQARAVSADRAFGDLDVMDAIQSELVDVGAAIEWLISQDAPSQAAELVVLCGGCYSRAFSSRRGVDEVTALRSRVDAPVLRAEDAHRGRLRGSVYRPARSHPAVGRRSA